MPPVFRFAPSPNGHLHLGHALSALLNHDSARQTGGTLLLRIDPAVGRARTHGRALASDRLELEGDRFFALIAAAYDDLAREQPDGSNPGAGYVRLALVQDSETTAEALHRIVSVLG